ncbi:MAG: hypothetical protein R6U97_13350 [Desulfosalsimonas sp.]
MLAGSCIPAIMFFLVSALETRDITSDSAKSTALPALSSFITLLSWPPVYMTNLDQAVLTGICLPGSYFHPCMDMCPEAGKFYLPGAGTS